MSTPQSTTSSTTRFLKRAALGAIIATAARFAYQQFSGPSRTSLASFSTKHSAIMPRAPVVCISHGGGPLPILGDPNHKDIVASLQKRVPKILSLGTPNAPRAIVLVTAHWQTNEPTISSGTKHELLYDYHGFPPESYKLKYDAPGHPEVAKEVAAAMSEQGLTPVLDPKRPWDHGVYIPFLLIHPAADIPIVQISILQSEDEEKHRRMGVALSKLRDSNVAIVGSGFASFHNLRIMMGMMAGLDPAAKDFLGRSKEWNAQLSKALKDPSVDARSKALEKWRSLPHAYEMHPKNGGDHFMPLLVCSAAAGDEEGKAYTDNFLGVDIQTFYWGNVTV